MTKLTVIIDENPKSAKVTKDALNSIGIDQVKIFYDLETARVFLEEKKILFMILDLEIKGESNLDFIKWLRRDTRGPNYQVPILMFTGIATKEIIFNARDAGITEFLVKPFKITSLTNIVLSFLKEPRNFIISRGYVGPDRRRRFQPPPDGIEKRSENKKDKDESYIKS